MPQWIRLRTGNTIRYCPPSLPSYEFADEILSSSSSLFLLLYCLLFVVCCCSPFQIQLQETTLETHQAGHLEDEGRSHLRGREKRKERKSLILLLSHDDLLGINGANSVEMKADDLMRRS